MYLKKRMPSWIAGTVYWQNKRGGLLVLMKLLILVYLIFFLLFFMLSYVILIFLFFVLFLQIQQSGELFSTIIWIS